MADIPKLKTELAAGHPDTGAYDADAQIAADQLNAVNRSINRASMSGDEMFSHTDTTDFAGLTAAKQSNWLAFCGRDSIDPWGAANVAFVQWIFGAGAATLTALAGARTTDVSRAVEVGIGFVHAGHVAEARASLWQHSY